jgi:hypothetical protein
LKPSRVGYLCIIPTLWLKKQVITGYFASIIVLDSISNYCLFFSPGHQLRPPLSITTAKAGAKIRSAASHAIKPLFDKFPQILFAIADVSLAPVLDSRKFPRCAKAVKI